MMETIVLDDGIEYLILNTEIIDGIKYTLFSNVNDDSDLCFRKTITENSEDFFVGLDDEKELEKVLLKFTENK